MEPPEGIEVDPSRSPMVKALEGKVAMLSLNEGEDFSKLATADTVTRRTVDRSGVFMRFPSKYVLTGGQAWASCLWSDMRKICPKPVSSLRIF